MLNAEPLFNPKTDRVFMTPQPLQEILDTVGRYPAETGGIMLGPKGEDTITEFYFDKNAERSFATYSPSYQELTALCQQMAVKGLELKGFLHSHPMVITPSSGDMAYVRRFFEANPDLEKFYMPIMPFVPLEEVPKVEAGFEVWDELIRFYVVYRDEPQKYYEVQLVIADEDKILPMEQVEQSVSINVEPVLKKIEQSAIATMLFPYPVMPVYGKKVGNKYIGYTLNKDTAQLGGWDEIGTLKFSTDVIFETSASLHPVEFTDDLYESLTSRTHGITSGLLKGNHVGFVGCGASINLIKACVRSGITEFSLFDKDIVEIPNIGRTAFEYEDIGRSKVEAVARHILNINPEAVVHIFHGDFLIYSDEWLTEKFSACDVIVMGTDSQTVQLRGNAIGKSLKKDMVFPGFYQKAAGGEIVVVNRHTPCYRCQVKSRFEDNAKTESAGDLKAESGLIFDCDNLDSIVGKIIIAMLLKNDVLEFKKFYKHISKNSLILCKHTPDFTIEGEDLFEQFFGNSPLAYAYETLWLDPTSWRSPNCAICGRGEVK